MNRTASCPSAPSSAGRTRRTALLAWLLGAALTTVLLCGFSTRVTVQPASVFDAVVETR